MDDDEKWWYAPNTMIPEKIYPELRYPGGGVTKEQLFNSLHEALDQCLVNLEGRINVCQELIKKIKKERENLPILESQ